MTPYYADDAVTLYHGDALAVLREMPAGAADCIVTSPPYYGLRDYGVPGQYGLESSPAEYVETMRAVFAEARRVLAPDGTLWLNVGDSYASHPRGSDNGWDKSRLSNPGTVQKMQRAALCEGRPTPRHDRPEKNLLGIPWRLAFALQDDCWTLRNDIVWHKPNAMPESVTDRLSNRYEHVFMFSQSRRYWFDLAAIREPVLYPQKVATSVPIRQHTDPTPYPNGMRPQTNRGPTGSQHRGAHNEGRNPGDIWAIPTQPFAAAHFACMPPALAERCVQAGCKPGGTVLDPFSGSGTTGLAATKHGRRYVGIDLNRDYLDLSLRTRLAQGALLDGTA